MMFTERNGRWADWIAARMQTPGTVFVAVGAGHLVGKDSLLVRLAERGIESRARQLGPIAASLAFRASPAVAGAAPRPWSSLEAWRVIYNRRHSQMSDQLTLPAEARDRAGKGASRALRRDGRVPAVVYGEKKEPLSIHVEEKLLSKMLSTGHFMNSVVMIDFAGSPIGPFPRRSISTRLRAGRFTSISCALVNTPR